MVGGFRCQFCKATNDYDMAWCPACRRPHGLVRWDVVLPHEQPLEAVEPVSNRRSKPLGSVKPFPTVRIGTGFDNLDRTFGIDKIDKTRIGARIPGTYFLGGRPGIGKTSLLHPWMAYLQGQGKHRFLFASAEQTHQEIVTDAHGFNLADVIGEVPILITQDINEVFAEADELDAEIVFIDSINKIGDSLYDTRNTVENKIVTAERIVADGMGCEVIFGTRLDARGKTVETRKRSEPIRGKSLRLYIVISQVNADDEIHGAIGSLHEVTGIFTMHDVPGFLTHRMVWAEGKNRAGATGVPAFFTMGERGLEETDNPIEQDTHEVRR